MHTSSRTGIEQREWQKVRSLNIYKKLGDKKAQIASPAEQDMLSKELRQEDKRLRPGLRQEDKRLRPGLYYGPIYL